jgi:Na+/glutamate symporter
MTKLHDAEDYNINYVKLLTIIVSVFLIGYFLEKALEVLKGFEISAGNYFQITAELLSSAYI